MILILDNILLCRGSSQLYHSHEYNTVTDYNSSSKSKIVYCVYSETVYKAWSVNVSKVNSLQKLSL